MDATQTTDPVFVMMRRRLLCVLLLCLSETQMDMALFAQSLVVSPSPQTPHWNHINVSDFGRALKYQGDASVRSTAYNWFGQHVDLAEVYGNAVDLRAPNPGMRLFIYQLDLSIFANEDSANLPEEYFLHFSENTEIRFRALNGSEVSTMTINGCPASEPVRRDCRVQSYLWTSRRYVYNLKSVAFQDWKATQLVQSTGRTINGVFLDEHGPGFIRPLSWGSQTVILSGGAIRELGGLRPGAARDALDQDYNTAMVAWLTYLQTRFHQAGKFIVLNPATYMLDPMVLDQIKALQGVSTEFMHRPDSWAGTYQYEEFIDVVKQVSSNGGTVDLAGTWCYTGPSGYTGGNYGSAQARYRMWRLASYYILKEPAGSSGIVYFDPSFCSNASVRPLEDASEWLLAYQVDVGQPVGQSVVYHEGSAGRSSSNAPCTFKVFGRTYTNALVLVRPKDSWNCTDYGDGSATTVTLPHPGYLLREDGTLSGPTNTVSIRNAEAVIIYGIATSALSNPTPSTPNTDSTLTQDLIISPPANTVISSPAPSPSISSVSPPNSPSSEKSSTEKPSHGLLGKLKALMQRVR